MTTMIRWFGFAERIVFERDVADIAELSDRFLEEHLSSLQPVHLWPWQKCGLVFRTRRHTKSWVVNYLSTEKAELDDEFVSATKYYTIHVLSYPQRELKFVFRLRTVGHPGYTQYGIAIVRIGEDFGCRE